ncbi:MAG: bifunctional DedA family/phosphatase PAP2 family protein [Actinobacteria bacterium]|nr:bifunctional DedA family/phosphatase PAP2 family protein [Actinomycetota bacterium]
MSRFADMILQLRGWPALAVIFALPALESSAFVGFVFPGEVAVLLGGVLAFQQRVSLPAALAAAVLGAVVGDTIGYEVGKRWGRRLLEGTIGRFVDHRHLDRAQGYLAERGGRAVFLGRFTAALRVVIPGMAGMSGMPYATFAAYNVAGGTLWASGFVLLGYAAGGSYRRVEGVAKAASLVLLLVFVLVVAVVLVARRIARDPERVRAWARRRLDRPWVVRVRTRYERPLAFLGRRLDPRGAYGLSLSAVLVALILATWAFAAMVGDVVLRRNVVEPDRRVLRFLVEHRAASVTTAMRIVSAAGSSTVLVPLALAVIGLWRWRRRNWLAFAVLAPVLIGASLSYNITKALVQRPRPPVRYALVSSSKSAFPSGHATLAAAVWGAFAFLAATAASTWGRKVAAWAVAFVVVALVGLSRLYLGLHWLSDVLGGWALGALWLSAVLALQRGLAGASGAAGIAGIAGATHVERPKARASPSAVEPG